MISSRIIDIYDNCVEYECLVGDNKYEERKLSIEHFIGHKIKIGYQFYLIEEDDEVKIVENHNDDFTKTNFTEKFKNSILFRKPLL